VLNTNNQLNRTLEREQLESNFHVEKSKAKQQKPRVASLLFLSNPSTPAPLRPSDNHRLRRLLLFPTATSRAVKINSGASNKERRTCSGAPVKIRTGRCDLGRGDFRPLPASPRRRPNQDHYFFLLPCPCPNRRAAFLQIAFGFAPRFAARRPRWNRGR